jgi:sugar lactone lactonase YvrE
MSLGPIELAYDARMIVGESPLWNPHESAIYWVDIGGFTIHRLHPASGAHREWRMASEPSTLALHAQGGLVVALRTGFIHFDPATGACNEIAAAPYDMGTTRFNDGHVDPAGRFWVGTIYEPRGKELAEMYCLEHGVVHRKWSGGMTVSNGLGFSPDGKHMYHADTTTHRVDLYDFDVETGTASNAQRFQQFTLDKANNYSGRPDGAAVDSHGNYWCAMIDGACLLQFSAAGALLRKVDLPVNCPTMMAFGGDDLRTLFITSLGERPQAEMEKYPLTGKLLSMRVDIAGRVEHAYQP